MGNYYMGSNISKHLHIKKITWIVALLLTSSCALREGKVDPSIQPYFDRFSVEAKARGKDVYIKHIDAKIVDNFDDFANIDPATVGVCDDSNDTIYVLNAFWSKTSDAYKELLVFHELGHCALHKDHGSCPNVMCEYLMGSALYLNNRSAFLDTLFR